MTALPGRSGVHVAPCATVRPRRFDVEATVALEDCSKGNTAASIPVLEKKLRESGFSLPEEFKP
jgi:hypothetical protein